MHHPEFPVVTLLCAALLLVPLPWHLRARNVATLSMIGWLFVLNVIYAVDAIVWANNVKILVPVWCDITTKVIVGGNFALPAACLCVCIHLEKVSSVRAARTTSREKRRRQIIEGLMCFGIPTLFMALHYIVQGHRFDIIEDFGCRPTIYASIPALILMWVVPLVVATLALGFAALALKHFLERRISFAKHLDNRAGLSTARYLRLIMMAVVEMVIGIAFTAYTLWFNTPNLQPWTSWADVHWHFSAIAQYPTVLLPPAFLRAYTVLWWMVPISSFIFVIFFAFGEDAIAEYKACFLWISRNVLRRQPSPRSIKHDKMSSFPMQWANARTPVSLPTPPPVATLSASSALSMLSDYKIPIYSPYKSQSDAGSTASLYSSPTTDGEKRHCESRECEARSSPHSPTYIDSPCTTPKCDLSFDTSGANSDSSSSRGHGVV